MEDYSLHSLTYLDLEKFDPFVYNIYKWDIFDNELNERFVYINLNGFKYPIYDRFRLIVYKELKPLVKDLEIYWLAFADGFKKGAFDFKKEIDGIIIKEVLIERVCNVIKEPILVSVISYNYDENQNEILTTNGINEIGIVSGKIYYCWKLILQSPNLYKKELKTIFSELNRFVELFYKNQKTYSIKKLDRLSPKKYSIPICELFNRAYLENYMDFIEIFKSENLHPKEDKPFLRNDFTLNNFPAISILTFIKAFEEAEVFKSFSGKNKIINKETVINSVTKFVNCDDSSLSHKINSKKYDDKFLEIFKEKINSVKKK